MQYKEMPADYVAVLRQIEKDEGDDMEDLLETVRIDERRLRHIIGSLHHKGLITVRRTSYATWLGLSAKGRRFVAYLHPNMGLGYA